MVALVVLAGGAAGAWYSHDQTRTREQRGSSTVEFVTTPPAVQKRSQPLIETVPWPMYGYDPARTHDAIQFKVRPPFRKIWTLRVGNIIEFPPVVGYGLVFVSQFRGRFFAVNAATGKRQWRKHFEHCAAASPAIGKDIVYQAYMQPHPCNRYPRSQKGFIVAILFRSKQRGIVFHRGKILWRFKTGAVESSPLLVNGVLYFGSWDHHLYALDVSRRANPPPRRRGDLRAEGDSPPAHADGMVDGGPDGGHPHRPDAPPRRGRWWPFPYSPVPHRPEDFCA